jgi:hypothetical protein
MSRAACRRMLTNSVTACAHHPTPAGVDGEERAFTPLRVLGCKTSRILRASYQRETDLCKAHKLTQKLTSVNDFKYASFILLHILSTIHLQN